MQRLRGAGWALYLRARDSCKLEAKKLPVPVQQRKPWNSD